MTRKLFVSYFVAFAATFVPVLLYFGIMDYVVPSVWITVFAGATLFRGKFGQSFWALAHLTIYLLLFYASARGAFWLSMRCAAPRSRWAIQVLILISLFSCSFAPVITYSSLQGRGGTYSFWGALHGLFERCRP